jgi:hypothetical protein
MNVNTHMIHPVITFLGGLFCLLPLFLGCTSYIENLPLKHVLTSRYYRDSSIATFSLAILLVIDTLADIMNNFLVEKNKNKKIMEKVLYLCGVQVLPLTVLKTKTSINLVLTYVRCNRCQLMVVGKKISSHSKHVL